MNDTIRRIIEMDKEARRLTDEARRRRAGSAEAVGQKKQEVSDNYLAMARQRVDAIRSSELRDAEQQWQAMEKQYAAAGERLEKCYEDHHEQWVSDIVDRVLSGDD